MLKRQSLLLLICLICFPIYGNTSELDLKISLPFETYLKKDNSNSFIKTEEGDFDLVCFSPEGGKTLADIYLSYSFLIEEKIEINKEILLLEDEIRILSVQIERYKQNIKNIQLISDIAISDRELGYDLYIEETENNKKENKNKTIKNIVISSGAGIVGIAVGIIVGAFIVR